MLIQNFVFFLSHCSLTNFIFLFFLLFFVFGFYAPQTRIHPKTRGLITITGPAKWHFIPNCTQIWQKFLSHRNISSPPMMKVSWYHVWTPFSTTSKGSRRNRLPLMKGGVEVVATMEQEKWLSYIQKLQMCWLAPLQPKTNPVTFKSF